MKKLTAFFLLSVLSLSLVACGNDMLNVSNDYSVSSSNEIVVEKSESTTDIEEVENLQFTSIEVTGAPESTADEEA